MHVIKGFKVECRKVLARDTLRSQTAHAVAKTALPAHEITPSTPIDNNPLKLDLHDANYEQIKESVLDTTWNSSVKSAKKLKYSGQRFDFSEDTMMGEEKSIDHKIKQSVTGSMLTRESQMLGSLWEEEEGMTHKGPLPTNLFKPTPLQQRQPQSLADNKWLQQIEADDVNLIWAMKPPDTNSSQFGPQEVRGSLF